MKAKLSWLKSWHAIFWYLVIGLILLTLLGCKSQKQTSTTQLVQRDTVTQVTIRERVDTVALPPALVRDTIREQLVQRDTVTVTDKSGKVALRYWRDQYYNIVAECNRQPDTVLVPVADTTREQRIGYRSETITETVKRQKPSAWQRFTGKVGTYLVVAAFLLILFCIVRALIKFY